MAQIVDLQAVRKARAARARRMARMFGKPKRYPGLCFIVSDTRDLSLAARRDALRAKAREVL